MNRSLFLSSALAVLACAQGCSSTTTSPTPAAASTEPEPTPTAPGDAGTDAPAEDLSKTPEATKLADELVSFLTGRFDSKDQSVRDTSYFSITLAVCAASAPAWPGGNCSASALPMTLTIACSAPSVCMLILACSSMEPPFAVVVS